MINIINIKTGAAYDLYIGRANKWYGLEASKWGNPFYLKRESDRIEVLAKYKEYILETPELYDSLEELEGLTLACWCYPKLCHGNALIELLEYKKNARL